MDTNHKTTNHEAIVKVLKEYTDTIDTGNMDAETRTNIKILMGRMVSDRNFLTSYLVLTTKLCVDCPAFAMGLSENILMMTFLKKIRGE